MPYEDTLYFLNVRVDNFTQKEALEAIKEFIRISDKRERTYKVFFTNVHTIHLSRKDFELNHCINTADLVLPDGSGLQIAGKILNKPIKRNLNGTDFTPVVCKMAEEMDRSVYLLGARESVVHKCRNNLQKRYPALTIKGAHHGYLDQYSEREVIEDINEKRPDIVLVAMGCPLQEKWITRNAPNIDAGVCFAVGGLFDFLSDQVKRAPKWMRDLGVEWIHRFFQNPRDKWDRLFIEIPVFMYAILLNRAGFSPEIPQITIEAVKNK